MLKADHARVQARFRPYEGAGNQAQQQRQLAEQIFTELEVHALLEEELFYPSVARAAPCPSFTLSAGHRQAPYLRSLPDQSSISVELIRGDIT
jgi:hypothetical protein